MYNIFQEALSILSKCFYSNYSFRITVMERHPEVARWKYVKYVLKFNPIQNPNIRAHSQEVIQKQCNFHKICPSR